MKETITNFLDKIGCDWIEKDGKIIISDEFQKDRYHEEDDMSYPYFLTEWNYPHSLNKELSEFNEFLDKEYGYYFECEWAGTFAVILKDEEDA